MDGPEKLARFLENAEKYVAPQAPYELPPPELLPKQRTAAEAKQMFPKPIELRGYCPVTFLEGKCRSVLSIVMVTCLSLSESLTVLYFEFLFPSAQSAFLPCLSVRQHSSVLVYPISDIGRCRKFG